MKKRYQVTLTEKNANEVKQILELLNLPPATFSNILDESLGHALPGLRRIADKIRAGEQYTFAEVVGEFVESLERGKE